MWGTVRPSWLMHPHKHPPSYTGNIYLEPVFPHHVEKNIDFFPPSKPIIEHGARGCVCGLACKQNGGHARCPLHAVSVSCPLTG